MLRFVESALSDNAAFYDTVRSELHGQTGIDIYSDEPLGSNTSCFDYSHEGDDDDGTAEEDRRYIWKNCKLTMDDDGLYWESASGKHGALLCYAIIKAELKPKHITLWIAPVDSSEGMSVIEFFKQQQESGSFYSQP
jgi:hypothetical protein